MKKMTAKRLVLATLLTFYILTMIVHLYKPLPKNTSYASPPYQVEENQVNFYYNVTGQKGEKKVFTEQIFTRTLEMIEEAEEFIVLDYFLFNGYHEKNQEFPEVSKALTEALVQKKQEDPNIEITFISDEVNTSYQSHATPEFNELKKNGIKVLLTDVQPLRDSMPIYSALWRMFIQWFGEGGEGWIPNQLAETAPDMTLRSYLKLFNVKANHRKTIATEKGTLISSGNPHDASAYFANTAFEVKNALINDLLITEEVAAKTRHSVDFPSAVRERTGQGSMKVQLLTEGRIQETLQKEVAETKKGEEIWIAMFYLADRDVIDSLTEAANRGVRVRLILDTNKNSFGQKKTGLPNIPISEELIEDTGGKIDIRWFAPESEQFHTKMMYIKKQNEGMTLSGSANYTSRNLNDFNLETNIMIKGPHSAEVLKETEKYFHRLWKNDGAEYTTDYKKHYEDISTLKRGVYTVQKLLHLTTY